MAITVLIVDDSAIMLNLIKQALSPDGYSLVLARNGEEGIAAFKEHEIDIVITDINMPVMDGIVLISELRKIDSNVPIFALTSEADEHVRERGRQAGANGWMVKPFQPAQFRDIIKQVVKRFGLLL